MIRPGFTGAGLDRADALRADPAALAQALVHDDARVLTMAGLEPELDEAGRLVWSAIDGHALERLILLGFDGAAPRFAPLGDIAPGAPAAFHLFQLLADMDRRDAAIWGAARSINEWHGRHRFCGTCASLTVSFRAGWGRRCAAAAPSGFQGSTRW